MATSILGQLLFEKKEKPQPYNPPTLAESQAAAIAGNQASLPGAEKLATDVDAFNQAALMKQLRGSIPGFDELISGITGNLESGLKGEIPKDVQDQVQNSAAARALAGGYGGSGMSGNLVARDLGLTSYNIAQQALKSSEAWLQTASQYLTAPRMDVRSAFVTPMQQVTADTERSSNMFNYSRYLEKLRIQPKPWQKAVEGLLDWIATTGESVAGAYAGNLGGMMGGGGGNQPSTSPTGEGGGGGGSIWGQGWTTQQYLDSRIST